MKSNVGKKRIFSRLFLIGILIAVFLFQTNFILAEEFRRTKENPAFEPKKEEVKEEKAAPEDPLKKSIAVLPLQKAFPAPLYLSTNPGAWGILKRWFKEKELKLGKQVDYDPQYVPQTLEKILVQKMFDHGFNVFMPHQVAPTLKYLKVFEAELPVERLKETIPADAFLVVTLMEWDSEKYDRDGVLRTSFDAILVDGTTKKVVWSNQAKELKITPPSEDMLYSKYQDEVLKLLVNRILKGFPKKEWN